MLSRDRLGWQLNSLNGIPHSLIAPTCQPGCMCAIPIEQMDVSHPGAASNGKYFPCSCLPLLPGVADTSSPQGASRLALHVLFVPAL